MMNLGIKIAKVSFESKMTVRDDTSHISEIKKKKERKMMKELVAVDEGKRRRLVGNRKIWKWDVVRVIYGPSYDKNLRMHAIQAQRVCEQGAYTIHIRVYTRRTFVRDKKKKKKNKKGF